jgi:hypothetical protein
MTETLLHEIWNKTNGHCHFCGDPVSFRNSGERLFHINQKYPLKTKIE